MRPLPAFDPGEAGLVVASSSARFPYSVSVVEAWKKKLSGHCLLLEILERLVLTASQIFLSPSCHHSR
jgi:hypothetical protein